MKRFLSLMLVLTLGIAVWVRPTPVAADSHWALKTAETLAERIGWKVPADLNAPMSPAAWNELLGLVVGAKPGPATYEQDQASYWLWSYTGALSNGPTIERQHALGGMVKMIHAFYTQKIEQPRSASMSMLKDASQVVDWQRPLLEMAFGSFLLHGYPDGTLRPTAPLLNCEAAVLAERILGRFGRGTGKLTFTEPTKKLEIQPVPGPIVIVVDGPDKVMIDPSSVVMSGPVAIPKSTGPWAPDGKIPMTPNRGGAGALMMNVLGAQYASALPSVGTPAQGHLWVLLDLELINESKTESMSLATGVAFSIEDGPELLYHYDMDRTASAAIGSPFASQEGVLGPGQSLRGKAAFSVPVGTKGFWYRIDYRLGQSKEKAAHWSGMSRGLVGDLPGPERVFPSGTSPKTDTYRAAGVYATQPEAEAVTAKARARQIPAWIEAQPDGRYAAMVGFLFFSDPPAK